jgi:hypothetical protein
MSHGAMPRAELVLVYKFMCRVWLRAQRWEEPLLCYLVGMVVVDLWERSGGELRLPKGLGEERPPSRSNPARSLRKSSSCRSKG